MYDHLNENVAHGHIAKADAKSCTCVFYCQDKPGRLWVTVQSTDARVQRVDWRDVLHSVHVWEYTDHTGPTRTVCDYSGIHNMVFLSPTTAKSIVIEIPIGPRGGGAGVEAAQGTLVYCRVDFDEPRGRRLGRPGDPPAPLPYEAYFLAQPRPRNGPVREWMRDRWDDTRVLARLAALGIRALAESTVSCVPRIRIPYMPVSGIPRAPRAPAAPPVRAREAPIQGQAAHRGDGIIENVEWTPVKQFDNDEHTVQKHQLGRQEVNQVDSHLRYRHRHTSG